ncbi:Flp pilus assembly protein CpaB [Actinoplanes sp. TFC3]|uniref:Flp pilus assembly protein CpaB n=1 Tax=Actinoplanes sp. TFC3 TaxID=1710355 RepID=UPI000829B605|nr:RcpC/CpaB family pilus assembly protein [Actinoplanes sp. TFC3]
MRRRVLIVLAALVLAGFSGISMLLYTRGVDQRAVDGRRAVSVLLATKQIPAGTTAAQIRKAKLARTVVMPAGTVPEGALTSLDPALDSLRLTSDLAPQQLVMRGLFSSSVSNSASTVGVPDEQLGISVEVSMAPGVAEKVTAGDRVTVFVTYPRDARASDQQTRVLIPAATVISITSGQPADVRPAPTPTRSTRTASAQSYPVTLAVDQQNATRLVHAAQTAEIYLGLIGEGAQVTPSAAVNYDSLWPKETP